MGVSGFDSDRSAVDQKLEVVELKLRGKTDVIEERIKGFDAKVSETKAGLHKLDREVRKYDDEKKAYENYPNKSLDLVLNRKISLDAELRQILVATRENCDGTGFPKKLASDKVPEAAQLIRFAREVDRRTIVRMGMPRVRAEEAISALLSEESNKPHRFSAAFTGRLMAALLGSENLRKPA